MSDGVKGGVVDCRRCGSCCVGPGGTRHYVSLSQKDVDRIPMLYAERHLEYSPVLDEVVLGSREHPDGVACAFFSGRVHGRSRCMIYEYRPDVCRTFGKGSGCEGWLLVAWSRGRQVPDGAGWIGLLEAAARRDGNYKRLLVAAGVLDGPGKDDNDE